MNHTILQAYIEDQKLPVVEKKYHKYLTFEGLEDQFTYILKDGIVKESVVSKYGQEFNLRYITGLEIISVLSNEYSQYMGEPYNVRVESDTATFYRVHRDKFLHDISNSKELQSYITSFYHHRLLTSMKKMQQMLTNGRIGAVSTQLYELATIFGKTLENGDILIDFSITNEELGKFCGISTASSVSRILKQLKNDGVIQTDKQKIRIAKLEQLEENIIF